MAVTTKLGLLLPEGDDFADVQLCLSNQLQKIDEEMPVVLTDSANPPLDPWEGKLVYYEDTDELYFWNGANWEYVLSRKNAWGRMAFSFSNDQGETVTKNTEKGPYIKCTFNQTLGRIYRVGYSVETDSVSPDDFGDSQVHLRYQYGPDVSTSDTLLYWQWADQMKNGGTSTVTHSASFSYTAEQTSQITIGMFLSRTVGDFSIFFTPSSYNSMFVEDIGWQE